MAHTEASPSVNTKKRASALIFGLILLAATLVLGEATWRLVQYAVSGTSPVAMLPRYRDRRFLLSPFLTFGPRIDWQIPGKRNPEYSYFNPQGFRTSEHVGPKAAGQLRIIALGGSTTEDAWNEDGLHWPLWLERDLQHRGLGVRVYNSGMSAYTSAHTLLRLAFDVLDYEPDFVLIMHNINDLAVNYRAAIAGETVDGHYRTPFAQKAFTGDVDESDVVLSRLFNTIRARLTPEPEVPVPPGYDIAAGLRYFKRNLANIDAVARNNGTEIVLLTMPLCDSESIYRKVEQDGRRQRSAPVPQSFEQFRRDFDAYNEAVRQVAAERDIRLVDMHRMFGGDEQFFADFVHYTSAGSERFGELLSGSLSPVLRDRVAARAKAIPAGETSAPQ